MTSAVSHAVPRVGLPYKVVGTEKVAPRALNISLSLGYYYRAQRKEHSPHALEPVTRTGLRRNVAMIREAIDGLKDAYLAGDRVPPVYVLARRVDRTWRSTLCVIDGAMRVAAAMEAGLPRIEVALIAPELEDTEPEELFLACNAAGPQRLTTIERDAALRALAHRYRLEHPDERDPDVFARRLQPRTGLAARTIVNAVRGEFRPRTVEQRQLAERLLREGKPVSDVARSTGVSRQAIQKQKDRLEGKQRSKSGSQRREPNPIVTGADIVMASLPSVDAPATAAALRLALKGQARPGQAHGPAQDQGRCGGTRVHRRAGEDHLERDRRPLGSLPAVQRRLANLPGPLPRPPGSGPPPGSRRAGLARRNTGGRHEERRRPQPGP